MSDVSDDQIRWITLQRHFRRIVLRNWPTETERRNLPTKLRSRKFPMENVVGNFRQIVLVGSLSPRQFRQYLLVGTFSDKLPTTSYQRSVLSVFRRIFLAVVICRKVVRNFDRFPTNICFLMNPYRRPVSSEFLRNSRFPDEIPTNMVVGISMFSCSD